MSKVITKRLEKSPLMNPDQTSFIKGRYIGQNIRQINDILEPIIATICAVWLAENMSINPKSVIRAISPMQKSEIECKMVKLEMIDSYDKIELGQTKQQTKITRRLKLFT